MIQMCQLILSFILPVYNGEQTVERAIRSVLEEKEISFELIVIDDGSRDQTGALCDNIAAEDFRVKVFHTENQGQGKARNQGILSALGRYLAFVDADDTVCWNGIKSMLAVAEEKQCDLVCGLYDRIDEEKTKRIDPGISSGFVMREGDADAVARYHRIKTASLFGYLWNKIYRRDFLRNHRLMLDDIKQVYMEDSLFILKLWSQKPVFYFLAEPVYCYYAFGESTTRQREPEIAQKYLNMLNAYTQYLEEYQCYSENTDVLVPLAMRVFCWSLVKNIPFEGLSKKMIEKRIQQFLDAESFLRILQTPKSILELKRLPSLAERVFYSFCYRCLKHGWKRFLALFFVVFYPGMKGYIHKAVK